MAAVSLSALFSQSRSDRLIASTIDGQAIRLSDFAADVAATIGTLREAGCRRGLLICDDAYWAAVGIMALLHDGGEALLPHNTHPESIASLQGSFDMLVSDRVWPGIEKQVLLHKRPAASDAIPAIDPANAFVSLFTSGSTGEAKRIRKSLAYLEAEARAVDAVLGKVAPANAWVQATATHQHLYGLTFRLCWPLASCRPFSGRTEEYWEPTLARLVAGSVLVSSPAHLTRLGGLDALPADRRPSFVMSGGAPLPQSAVDAVRDIIGCDVVEMFGSTETGVVGHRWRSRESQSWSPYPTVSVARDADGRLRVRSPYSGGGADGYVIDDLVEIAADGRFRLLGRADRIAKVEGNRVSLLELEEALARLEWVREAAIVQFGGDAVRLGAVVLPSEEGRAELEKLGAFRFGRKLRGELAAARPSAGLPRQWRFVDRLPASVLGKVSRGELLKLFERANP
ncbi:MAG: acyl-CoA synthetase [Alphaproteobacteria bacterium]|nr:acyl-CoA synthetase [Alphaproteobacteria bacterium]